MGRNSTSRVRRYATGENAPATEFGNLYSHHSTDHGKITPHRTRVEAIAEGASVRQAQPGIESVLMWRVDKGEWQSLRGSLSIREVIERIWSA